ncbi:MAG TPA: pyruvate dehydrogenase (acetyl-transferring) E1 component subunit alpha, partial [Bacillus bacterium]|nr:pyruvate dehydrogenase (acetyl-transferring) E1 component subunit alpha [Bacillus sp. (in: firmicutes)]
MDNHFPILQVMDQNGNIVSEEHKDLVTEERVKKFFSEMVRIRTFDRKSISLQRQG